MTIKQAIKEVIDSEAFMEQARSDARLRVFLGRWNAGEIKENAAMKLLKKFGYKINIEVTKRA